MGLFGGPGFSLHWAGTWLEAIVGLHTSMGRGFLDILIRECLLGSFRGKWGLERQATQQSFQAKLGGSCPRGNVERDKGSQPYCVVPCIA